MKISKALGSINLLLCHQGTIRKKPLAIPPKNLTANKKKKGTINTSREGDGDHLPGRKPLLQGKNVFP